MREIDKKRRRAVALFTYFEWVSVSGSVLNTARFLSEKGYEVDLYLLNSDRFGAPVFGEDRIRCRPLAAASFPLYALRAAWRYLWPHKRYAFTIGFDPQGAVITGLLSRLWRVPYLFHSLEIAGTDQSASFKRRAREAIERWFIRGALFLLTQDDRRADALARQYDVPRSKVLVAPNTPMGDALPARSDFLREKLGIAENECIVLAVGSLMRETMVDRATRAAFSWPKGFVLVLHGWIPDPELEAWLRVQAAKSDGRVRLSTDLLPESRKYEVFQSADIGLVLFAPVDQNFTLAAGSAGKLYDFMRVGVPVIGNDIPGMRELVEGNGIGHVVNGPEDIGTRLTEVWTRRDEHRMAGLASYDRYRFEKTYAGVLKRVENTLALKERNRTMTVANVDKRGDEDRF